MYRNKNNEKSPVPVRPHHGMCLAYFKGYGYSDGFSVHMQEMLELFEQNVFVKLTVATDEICSACPNNQDGVCKNAGLVREYDEAVLNLCGIKENTELPFLTFSGIVQKKVISAGNREKICGGCQWNEICCSQKSRWENARKKLE